MSDERFYAEVVRELASAGPIPGLWAKAFAETGGNEAAARALYLRLRVSQLLEEEAATLQAKHEANLAMQRQAATRQEEARAQELAQEDAQFGHALRWITGALLAIVLFAALLSLLLPKTR